MLYNSCGNSSVDRAMPCQGIGRGFEPRFPLHIFLNLWRHSQVVRHESAKLRFPGSNPGVASKQKTIKCWNINILSFFICLNFQNKNTVLSVLFLYNKKIFFFCWNVWKLLDKNLSPSVWMCPLVFLIWKQF